MAFPRCEGIQYSRGSRLNPDVGTEREDGKASQLPMADDGNFALATAAPIIRTKSPSGQL